MGKFTQRPNEILLRTDLMDKQIVDIDGRKVVRVNDLRLDEIEGAAPSRGRGRGRRRACFAGWGSSAAGGRSPGTSACPSPSATSTGRTWTRSRPRSPRSSSACPTRGLAELHPADLADIIDQLAPKDRAGVLASLDDEAAADVFEEMEPETQVEVLEDLDPARAADILEEMSPDDAADLVADLSDESREEILALMERDEAEELGELLAYPEDTAGGMMTTEFITLSASYTCAQAIDRLREMEPDAETIYYVYVVDADDRLVGVLSLRDLIVAKPATPIAEVMIPEPVTVGVLADEDEVAEIVAHYNLLAVPVIDASAHLVGIVTVDDAMDAILPDAWRKRLPRLAGRS